LAAPVFQLPWMMGLFEHYSYDCNSEMWLSGVKVVSDSGLGRKNSEGRPKHPQSAAACG